MHANYKFLFLSSTIHRCCAYDLRKVIYKFIYIQYMKKLNSNCNDINI